MKLSMEGRKIDNLTVVLIKSYLFLVKLLLIFINNYKNILIQLMRRNTLVVFLFISAFTFSQSNKVIQNYLNSNTAKFGLSKKDVLDWTIQSEATSSATNIDNCYVIQTYNGIEIFRAVSNFAIKDKRVINTQNKFIANVSRSIPLIRLFQQLRLCLKLICNWESPIQIHTAEKISQHKYKITDNIRNHGPIEANLVYHQAASDNLPLACLLLNHQITTTCGA
jgi:hypothetical protein